jgi:Domain of unknown function (DUF3883)
MTHAPNPSNPSAFLYYWKIYWDDSDKGHLPLVMNQNSRTMQRIRPGDVVWAFTRRMTDGAYVLVARFLVSHVGENKDGNPAGRWYFASDTGNFRYLDPQTQEDAEPVIRRLGIKADAPVLGNSFQGGAAVRQISIEDLSALDRHANGGGGGESDGSNGNTVAAGGWRCAPDAAHNAAVEAAAIAFVRSRLGEETRDRQRDNCGWDLEYTQAGRSLCVEVKGLSGSALGVELSPNEYAAMKRAMNKSFSEGQYRLAIVRNALTTAPELFLFAHGSGMDWICELTSTHISVTERIAARLEETRTGPSPSPFAPPSGSLP